MLNVIMLSAIMLIVANNSFVLSVLMLKVLMLNVVMLSVVAPYDKEVLRDPISLLVLNRSNFVKLGFYL
jgi:hypothetical protein